MTISTELRKAGPFTGNGVTTAFPFSFKVFAASDVAVTRADTLGAEAGLVLNTDFTVALNADQDAVPGGTVTLAAPLSTGYRLVVSSAVPNLQPTDITNNGGFYPRVIEDALDRHVAQIQQIDEKVDRALKVAVTSPLGDQALPSPVAGMLIGWNESNDGLKNYAPIGGTLLGQQLAAANGSSLVGFQQAGAGSVVRTAQDKLRESVKIGDYSSLQAALDTGKPVEVTDGTWTVAGGAVCAANAYIFGAGTLQGDGANPVITVPAGATGVTIEGIKLKGYRLTNESAAGDIGVIVQESGIAIRNCEISYFASRGIELASQVADAFSYQSVISGCWIHDNGTGVNTNAYEYCRIDGNRITNNGWNNARTGFAPLSSSLGAGIYGNCANSPILNNQVTANAFGIYLIAGLAAPNPDHSIIGFNAINHNGAAGLVLVDLKSYELVIGNTIISNVSTAPSVVYAPTGATVDMALVNVHGLVFEGNAVGTGSDSKIPIYGHARCRYVNNEFLYGPPTELAVPSVGSPLRDTWGYAVNADNIWRDNWFFAFSRPVLFGSTVRTQVSDNLENGMLIDGSAVSPAMAANWAGTSPGYDPVRFWRTGGDTVHVVGSLLPSAGASSIAFTLPLGYRPLAGAVDAAAVISDAGAIGYSRVYTSGDVQIPGFTDGQTVVLNMTFRCR